MCSRFKDKKGETLRPGQMVEVMRAIRERREKRVLPWAGFARSEIMAWWLRQGSEEVEIEASAFAERSDVSGELVWEDLPEGRVIAGLIDRREGKELLKVVTRGATHDEFRKFAHPRMPVTRQRSGDVLKGA